MSSVGAGVAQSVLCLTTDWTTGVRSPTEAENFSSSLCFQTGDPFPGGKARPGRNADQSPHLVPRLRMSRSSFHPMRLHGM
jgi:hypothetical protein